MAAPRGNKNAIDNNGGRPTKYKDEYASQAFKLALLGATDKEIADFFGVSERCLNKWKKSQIEFVQSLNRGKMASDAEVANSLYKRALGYKYDEVTFERIDSKINLEITSAGDLKKDDAYKKKVVTKEVAPDVTAQIFFLKNRQKSKWRDKQDVNNILESLSDADLERLMNLLINRQ